MRLTAILLQGILLCCISLLSCQPDQPTKTVQPTISAPQSKSAFDTLQSATPITIPGIPDSFTFCGEDVPLYRAEIAEKLDRELLIATHWHSKTILALKRSKRYFAVIEPILASYQLPEDLKYMVVIESGFENVESYRGAGGFWQIMPRTGKEYGLTVAKSVDERYHLEKATHVACEYLQKAYKKLGSYTLAAASYNMGMAGVQRRLRQQEQTGYYHLHLNSETSRYVFRILAAKYIFEQPANFGFNLKAKAYYPTFDYSYDTLDARSVNWISYAIKKEKSYAELRLHNPWIRRGQTRFRRSHRFVVRWPK